MKRPRRAFVALDGLADRLQREARLALRGVGLCEQQRQLQVTGVLVAGGGLLENGERLRSLVVGQPGAGDGLGVVEILSAEKLDVLQRVIRFENVARFRVAKTALQVVHRLTPDGSRLRVIADLENRSGQLVCLAVTLVGVGDKILACVLKHDELRGASRNVRGEQLSQPERAVAGEAQGSARGDNHQHCTGDDEETGAFLQPIEGRVAPGDVDRRHPALVEALEAIRLRLANSRLGAWGGWRLRKGCNLLAERRGASDGSPVLAVGGYILRAAKLPVLEHLRDDARFERSEHLPRLPANLIAQSRGLLTGRGARRILGEAQQLEVVVRPGELYLGSG